MENNTTKKRSLILIVDDNPVNLQLLGNKLREENVDIAVAKDGEKAIKIAKSKLPQLILLDIMMPEMDGYEVCRTLKEDEDTKDIPIIFLTAKVSSEDIIRGFNLGAVDYITKPFNPKELLSRVNTHLRLREYTNELSEKNQQLQTLMNEKNEFLGIAAHDLKNPIYSISMLAKVLRDEKDLSRDEIDEFTGDIVNTADKMLMLIKNLLDINAIEQGKITYTFETIDLSIVFNNIYDIYHELSNKKSINFHFENNAQSSEILTDLIAIRQILDNMVSNAVKYTPKGKNVFLKIYDNNDYLNIEIKDEGPGFTDEDITKLWGKFTRLSAQPTGEEHSTGLGMSIVKKYADAIGAKVELNTQPGIGSIFTIILPKTK